MKPPLLLPVPQTMRLLDGQFAITDTTRIHLTPGCGDGELAVALELAEAIERHAGRKITVDRITSKAVPADGIGFVIDPQATVEGQPDIPVGPGSYAKAGDAPRAAGEKRPKATKDVQASSGRLTCSLAKRENYVLRVSRDRVEVIGATAAGLFYGVQTLIQLVRQYGRRLPALRIEDAPDFRYRGFMLDVSRGRVPTLEYLKSLVHTLSHFKINMLQLYIEHTFHFRSHPEIGRGCDPLEPDEILELDRYCRSRHVELAPSLQSFGHMGRILSLPKYRHLAELVQFEHWEKAPWPKRLHGMAIAPGKRETYELLADLYRDFLPLFSSHLFNLNSDETWDLGKGQSAKAARRIGVGRLYLRHIEKIAELARLHGRTPMLWADIIYQHPELIPDVPEDIVLLDWNYAHDAPFDQCAKLADAGHRFLVCSGTSGWDQVFNDVWNATRNIRRFAAAGKRHGAIGVLNTDWGDCGHFNMPGTSLHGAVLGAAVSWREGAPGDDKTFDRAFSLHVFDDKQGTMGRAIRRAGSLIRETTGRYLETWPLWFSPLGERRPGREIPPDAAVKIIEAANAIVPRIATCRPAQERDPLACLELSLGVLMLGSLAARAVADHRQLGLRGKQKPPRVTYRHWAKHAEEILAGFEAAWNRRSKPSNLRDVRRVFRRQIRAAQRM